MLAQNLGSHPEACKRTGIEPGEPAFLYNTVRCVSVDRDGAIEEAHQCSHQISQRRECLWSYTSAFILMI